MSSPLWITESDDEFWFEAISGKPDYLRHIPWNMLPIWKLLQAEIRRFSYTGLLVPFYSKLVKPHEHYRNHSKHNVREAPYSIILRLLEVSPYLFRSLFPNDIVSIIIQESPSQNQEESCHIPLLECGNYTTKSSINSNNDTDNLVSRPVTQEILNGIIPVEFQNQWRRLQQDIRSFAQIGLLVPSLDLHSNPSEHYNNISQNDYRQVPYALHQRLLLTPRIYIQKSLRNVKVPMVMIDMDDNPHRKFDIRSKVIRYRALPPSFISSFSLMKTELLLFSHEGLLIPITNPKLMSTDTLVDRMMIHW